MINNTPIQNQNPVVNAPQSHQNAIAIQSLTETLSEGLQLEKRNREFLAKAAMQGFPVQDLCDLVDNIGRQAQINYKIQQTIQGLIKQHDAANNGQA